MRQGLIQTIKRFHRDRDAVRGNKSRPNTHHRRLLCEALENRLLLADPNDQISEADSWLLDPSPGSPSTFAGDIDVGTDVDMFRINVTAGERIAFDIDERGDSNIDSYIRLFNQNGTELDHNDDGAAPGEPFTYESYLEFAFGNTGAYYLGVSGYGNSSYNPITGDGDSSGETGMYTIIATDITPEPPDPDLVSVSISDSTVRPGDTFTVTISAQNDGSQTDEGSIHAVVRYADGSDDVAVSELRNVSWALQPPIHWEPGEGAGQIYNKDSATPRSQAAEDWFLEAVGRPWSSGTTQSMTFDVTPQKAGNLQVLVRTTMHTGPDPEDWVNDISANTSNPTTNDEQGWQTRVYPVQVAYAPSPDLVSVSISDSSVAPGEMFTVTVTAQNDGSQTDEGSIHAVVRYADGSDDVAVSELRNVSWALQPPIHWEPGEGAGQIYNKDSATPRSQAAEDWFLEAVGRPWSSGTTQSMTFDVTPQKAGNLQVLVRTTMHTGPDPEDWVNDISANTSNPTTNDEQGWQTRVYPVQVAGDFAQVIDLDPPPAIVHDRGDSVEANVQVKNMGTTTRSFWVGLSFFHPESGPWPNDLNWYDVPPLETEELSPGVETTVTFRFKIPDWLPPNQYTATTAVWHGYDRQNNLMLPDGEPYGGRWVEELSFSLQGWDFANNSVVEQLFSAASNYRYSGDLSRFVWDMYYDNVKPLIAVSGSLSLSDPFTLGIVVIGPGASFTLVMDAADLFGATPESRDDETVTIWVDGGIGIKAGVDPIPISFGFIEHEFTSTDDADDRRDVSVGAGLSLFFFDVGIDWSFWDGEWDPYFQWNLSFGVAVELEGSAEGLVGFEVDRTLVLNAFDSAFLGLAGPLVGDPMGAGHFGEALMGYLDESPVNSMTLDDGNWRPEQPSNMSPSSNEQDVSLAPLLQASAFQDKDDFDTHFASHWRVDDDNDFSSPVLDYVGLGSTSFEMTAGSLNPDTEYSWQVRYQDDDSEDAKWSNWSEPTSFTTGHAPTVIINQASGQVDPTNGSPIDFAVVFSDPVTGFSTGDVTLSGAAPGTLVGTVTGSGTTYNVAVSGMTGSGTVIAGIGAAVAEDGAGNPNLPSTSTDNIVTYDTTAPTITINQAAAQADPTADSPINFTVVFSEPVTGFQTGDVTLSGTAPGTLVGTVTGSGTTYNVAVSGMSGIGTVTARVDVGKATDAAGNPNVGSTSADNTVTYDFPPTITINQAAAQADPTADSPINFTVVFSEPVTGFQTGDVTLSGTAPGTLVGTVTGSGTTYNVAVSGMSGNGTIIATIGAGVATDGVGSSNLPSTSADNTVTYEPPPAGVQITESGDSTSVVEGGATDAYEVVLVSAPTANVTITVAGDSQVSVAPTTLIFTTTDWNQSQTVTVTAVDDDMDESTAPATHTGAISHSASSTDARYNGIDIDTVTANITDDDTAGITVELVGPVSNGRLLTGEGAVGIAKGDLAVRLGVAPDTVAVLSVTAQEFSDSCLGAARPGEVALTVMTSGFAMLLQGGGNTFEYRTISLESPSQIRLVQFAGQNWLVPLSATFTVVLDTQPVADVTIDLSSSDTTEGTVSPTSLTFQPEPGNWDTPKTVTITGVNDDLDDGDIAYTIVTAAASSADTKYSGINPANVSVTNEDDDTQGLIVSTDSVSVPEGATSKFTVQLSAQPTSNVTVDITKQAGGDADLSASPTSLTFTSSNWKNAQDVTVSAAQDADTTNGTATFTVSSSGLTSETVTATEEDDDAPQIIDDGDAGFVATSGWTRYPGYGYLDDLLCAPSGTGSVTATWEFAVTPGVYEVAATWLEYPNRATDAPYSVYDGLPVGGSTLVETVDVNQKFAPDDFYNQVWWETIGEYTITSNTLTVRLTNDANGYVIADAVRIKCIDDTTPPEASSSVPNIISGGGSTHSFTVTYTDNVAVDVSDLDSSDIQVTGPNSFNQNATFISVNTNSDGTPRTATYRINVPGGTWDSADNGTYTVSMRSSQVSDTSSNYVLPGTLDTFEVSIGTPDTTLPEASSSVPNITIGGGSTHSFTVTYTDNVAVDVSDLDSSDIQVTGPNSFNQNATFISVNTNSDGTPRTATYRINVPGGTWDSADNGTYTVSMRSSQVSDTSSNYVLPGTLDTFNVNIPENQVQIVDDGDPHFGSTGGWARYPGYGLWDDLLAAGSGFGSVIATWTFSVTPGSSYEVATTWLEYPNRATNAPYTIYDGETPIVIVPVNQKAAPNDFVDQDEDWGWEILGEYLVTSNTLTVQLTDDANGVVIADAVRIRWVADSPSGPEIVVLGNGVSIPDDDTTPSSDDHTNFGAVLVDGGSVTRIFTIQNTGIDPLHLTGDPKVEITGPHAGDFTVIAQPNSPVAANNGTTTFQVKFDPSGLDERNATLHIPNDDADENPFDFAIRGTGSVVPSVQKLDDGDPGFDSTSGWTRYPGYGHLDDLLCAGSGYGSETATWTFSVTPGVYEVATTWLEYPNRATDAPYSVYDGLPVGGSTLVETVDVNQKSAPDDFADQGVGWENLGEYPITSNTLTVQLTDDANGYVIADAVRIAYVGPLSAPAPPLPLLAAGGEVSSAGDVALLNEAGLQPIVLNALSRWTQLDLPDDLVKRLERTNFVITDLPGSNLGMAFTDRVYLDRDAAGHG